MKRWIAAWVALAVLALATPGLADYFFQVNRNISDVTINKDGSITLDYNLTFTCEPSGKAIDIVDVGLPNKHYHPSDFSASIDGVKLPIVRQSEYVKIGVEIPLTGHFISPGKTGTLHVSGKVDRMVFEDDDDKKYASVEFSPTWYGSEFTTGTTHMEIRVHFPMGVGPDQTKWHALEPDQKVSTGDQIVFTWVFPSASPSATKKVGVSFPKEFADKIITVTFADRIVGCFAALGGCLLAILFPWVFPFGLFGFIFFAVIRGKKRRMLKYLPPELAVEGVGIKRGLTAPEAALIQQMTLDRVLVMMLFGLIKKQVVKVTQRDPLKLKKFEPEGINLHPYEKDFLECIKKDGGFSQTQATGYLVKFIKATNRKLKGFSRKETVAYYKKIAEQAWQMVEKADTPAVLGEAFDQQGQWLLMDDKPEERFGRLPHPTVLVPRWWIYTNHGYGTTPGAEGGAPSMSLPDFANSVTNSISGFADGMVSSVSDFTSGITGKTNPPPVSTSSGRSSGGGGGCACACACAGCACACAGGGR